MTFEVNTGMSSVELFTGCVFDVIYCRVDKQLKVFDAYWSSVEVVEGSDAVVITDRGLELVEEPFSIFK